MSMQMKINILNTEVKTGKGSGGKAYKFCNVDYKDINRGTAASKKIMAFGTSQAAYIYLEKGPRGPHVVEAVKEGDYWQWVSIKPDDDSNEVEARAQSNQINGANLGSAKNFTSKDDERQALIVRQSSAKAAIDLLTLQGNKKATLDDVVSVASKIEDYVFGRYEPQILEDKTEPVKVKGGLDIDDDIPF